MLKQVPVLLSMLIVVSCSTADDNVSQFQNESLLGMETKKDKNNDLSQQQVCFEKFQVMCKHFHIKGAPNTVYISISICHS